MTLPTSDTKEEQKPEAQEVESTANEPKKPFWADFEQEKKDRLKTVLTRRIKELGEQEVEYELQAGYTMSQLPLTQEHMRGLEEKRAENGKKLEAGKAKGALSLPRKERDEHKAYMESIQADNKKISQQINGAVVQSQKIIQTTNQYVGQADTARDFRTYLMKQLELLEAEGKK